MNPDERTIKAITTIFNARSIAVVGVSNDPKKLGYMTLNSIITGGFDGLIYPINPKGGEVLGLRVYRSLSEISDSIDLVAIVVPADFVPNVLQEAVDKGIPGAVILSAGFREAGNIELEKQIISIARRGDLRFVGPNVQGINYLPNKLCVMFFPVITKRGPLAILTQSGSATAALSEWAADEGFGISAAVNLGNQSDLCESDYLEFFAIDKHTSVIAMYIEGVEDGRRFFNTLKKVTDQKPVVILKSGRTEIGKKATQSHTGSLAGSHDVFYAACHQAGAVTANNLEGLFDYAKALAGIRLPNGPRVLSISTSGGMGALAADETEKEKLVMPSLSKDFVEELKKHLNLPLANISNPIDLGYVDAEAFRITATLADKHNVADIILTNIGDPVPDMVDVALELFRSMKASLVVSYLGGGEEEKYARVKMQEAGISVFPCPERAIRGIGAVVKVAEYKRKSITNQKIIKSFVVEKKVSKSTCYSRLLPEPDAANLLKQYKIPYPNFGLAHNPTEAVEIARRIDYPVVLKVVSPDISHKTETGGLAFGIDSDEQVLMAYEEIMNRVSLNAPSASVDGILVCQQSPPGEEVIIGALNDPVFGPTIMFGLGGIFAELLKDVSFKIAPLERSDAEQMVKEIKGYPVLTGFRGRQSCDINCLIDLLMSISRLVTERTNIKELDLNPVRLFKQGLMVLDARIIEMDGISDEKISIEKDESYSLQ